jgi:hypothetical protein
VLPEHLQPEAAGVAEAISAAAAAGLMRRPGLNLQAVPADAAADFMGLVEETILGTDMAVSRRQLMLHALLLHCNCLLA